MPLPDGPALISVNIYLRNIHKIDDVKMVRDSDVILDQNMLQRVLSR